MVLLFEKMSSSVHLNPRIKKRVASILISSGLYITPLPQLVLADGITNVDGEVLRIFRKAKATELEGSVIEAQNLYEQVVQAEPEFIFGWSNLGNVLTARGNLNDAILVKCVYTRL